MPLEAFLNTSGFPVVLCIMSPSPCERLPMSRGGAGLHPCCLGVSSGNAAVWTCQQDAAFKVMRGGQSQLLTSRLPECPYLKSTL